MLGMGQPPTPAGTQPDPKAQALNMVVPLVLMIVLFYFVLIRPQSKKQKEHAQMLKTVKPGDKIVTSGGVVGVVITVKEKTLTMRSADAKFEITKSAIAEISERGGSEGSQS
jgi:preprotein translocase subunit YajC